MINNYTTTAINSWQLNKNNYTTTATNNWYKVDDICADICKGYIYNSENFGNKIKNLEKQIKKLEEIINKEKKEKEVFMDKEKDITKYAYCEELALTAPYIVKVEILKPGKVLRFTFSDGAIIKTVCLNNDTFDFKFAFFLAYAKYLWGNLLTTQGVENKAKTFTDIKFFNTLVKKGMKVYFNQKKEEEKLEKEKAERKEIKANRIAKKIAKKEKARENRINEMAEAIKRAKASE